MSFFVYYIILKGVYVEVFALIFLGLLQGLTEFLPISSSGHLVLFGNLFHVEETLFVSIVLHCATLLSVIVVLRKEIWFMLRHPFSQESINLMLATIPTCVIALTLLPFASQAFNGKFLGVSFLISAFLLFIAERKKSNEPFASKQIAAKEALVMGLAQGLAIFPGVSRSGTTISAGLYMGTDKKKCAKFSFLMSLPIILLSLFMEIYQISTAEQTIAVSYLGLALAFLVAFIAGTLSIKLMIKLTSNSNLKYFSAYLVLIAIASFVIL